MMTPNGGVFGRNPTFSNVTVENNLTLTNGNFIIGTSGKGIDFSATSDGTGTMTSELLSDYEEGTWTPDLLFGGANTGITYGGGLRNGSYTKIGRAVVARCWFTLTSKGTATGSATIAGLPFTSAGSSSHSAGSFSGARITLANYDVAVVNLGGTTTIELNELVSGALPSALTDAAFQNTSIVTVTITYFT